MASRASRIGEGHLRHGQLLVAAFVRADKRRRQHRRPLRIQQTEADRVDELARLLERADRLPVQPPLLAAKFLELLFVHKKGSN